MHKQTLNFVPHSDRLHLLQAGTIGVLLMCGVLAGVLIGGGGQRTATIAAIETSSPTPSSAVTPNPFVKPKVIGDAPIQNSDNARAISPDGQRVVYLSQDSDLALFISNTDGSDSRRLLATRVEEVHLDWPQTTMISMSSKRSDRVGRDLVMINMTGAITPIMSNRENLEYAWSPNGSKLLFSYFMPDSGISLLMYDVATGTEFPLGLATSARKCAWHTNGTAITCGVPIQSNLARDVPSDHSATVDDIATISFVSGEQSLNYRGSSDLLIGITDPEISPSGDFVFTNIFDRKRMSLNL